MTSSPKVLRTLRSNHRASHYLRRVCKNPYPGRFQQPFRRNPLVSIKASVFIATSLDGFIARSNGDLGDVGRQVRKRRYPVIGHGEGTYSFIHIDDAASATVAALERARPGVYNVVDDEPATAAEWMPVYAEALGAKRPLRVPAFVARLIAGRALVEWPLSLRGASNEKINEEFGWRPQYESWRRGFFEDVAAVIPGGVAN